MLRLLSIALIASLCFAFTARAEDKPSPAVKRILDKAVGKVRANRQDFDKANAKPLGDARSALEELSKQQTSDGKTKDAIATLQQAETLERDVMAMVSGGKPTLSPAVKPILDQAVLGVIANRQALQKANETPLSEARSALEELAKKQTKDGKTKEAIATLQQVEALEHDVMAMAKAPVPQRPEKVAPRVMNPDQQGAVTWNGHKYKYFADNLTWPEAKAKCEAMGGYLVTIDDDPEWRFVFRSISGMPNPPKEILLGVFRDTNTQQWLTVHGEPMQFAKWAKGKPAGEGPYVLMWIHGREPENGLWLDYKTRAPFICEWDE